MQVKANASNSSGEVVVEMATTLKQRKPVNNVAGVNVT